MEKFGDAVEETTGIRKRHGVICVCTKCRSGVDIRNMEVVWKTEEKNNALDERNTYRFFNLVFTNICGNQHYSALLFNSSTLQLISSAGGDLAIEFVVLSIDFAEEGQP
ncbi:hypothetical protein RF11_10928 [Thelohanellus kitauei]|uniref:Uncharacterized protein n=1 Tax=Thelohanellus kitauei TaxID=669202 RepID=A0A0C2MH16_THEKT|nr:hypothetical protein RF11_10928 [Thelohanellus kitauei]